MRFLQAVCTFILALIFASTAWTDEREALPRAGSYEVTYRLELPHVESWAVDKTRTICVAETGEARVAPLPVLSGNNPLATCPAQNIRREGGMLRFDIVCPGRNAAQAHAAYALAADGFKGRIAMVMGAKNMTMTEVQVGHRIGGCDLASAPQD